MSDLVLIPGLNNTAATFYDVIGHLPQDINALALDCPPLDSVEAVAEALLPTLPPRFYLGGFSFGGYVALAMLERAPERIQGIAMICSASYPLPPEHHEGREAAIATARESGGHMKVVTAQGNAAFHPKSAANPALVERRLRIAQEYGAERFIAHTRAVIDRPDRTALLAQAGKPVLMLAADTDRAVPAALMRQMAAAVPGAIYEEIAESGHLLPLEQPAAMAASLGRWIAALERRAA